MQITPFVDLYQMSIGSVIFCLKDIKAQLGALPEENEELAKRVDQALTTAEEARRLRFRWDVQNRQNSKGRGRATETDNAIDKTLSAMNDQLVALGRNGRRPERQQKARELKRAFFVNGVRPLSGLTFEDELAAVEEMLERLDADFADHVDECGLTVLVDQLRDLADQFGNDLDVRQTQEVSYDEVRAAEASAREDFNHVMVTILADYRATPDQSSALLEQVVDQQDRIASHLKRNGTIPDVDPNTGEVLDPDTGEPVEPTDEDVDGDPEPSEPAADDSGDEPVAPAEDDADTDTDPVEPIADDDPVEA